MRGRWWCLAATLLLAGADGREQDVDPSQARLSSCLVSLIEQAEVPAQEAGRLIEIEAREGLEVEAEALLARIDDEQAQHQKRVVEFELKSTKEEATNDVRVRHAKASASVAMAEYQQSLDANKREPGVISATEVRRRQLALRTAELQAEQAQLDQRVAGLTSEGKEAELAAAETAIRRREIRAPVAGQVVEVMRHRGEWVQPGDPVLRLVRLDRLRVEGFLSSADYGPEEVSNRPVLVQVQLARGRVETFRGKIVFVNPLVEADGEYKVWAEVLNRSEAGQWLMRPGQTAEMTIDLNAPATPGDLTKKPAAGRRGTR
jgi:multidrug efflux pump subunit AcrA (membrane-fusion protein)